MDIDPKSSELLPKPHSQPQTQSQTPVPSPRASLQPAQPVVTLSLTPSDLVIYTDSLLAVSRKLRFDAKLIMSAFQKNTPALTPQQLDMLKKAVRQQQKTLVQTLGNMEALYDAAHGAPAGLGSRRRVRELLTRLDEIVEDEGRM